MKPLPQVAIVGFPNVGKSTLFNRLLGQRKSLVHSQPGMTRDTVSAVFSLGGKAFVLTDTGGLADTSGEPLSQAVFMRAWKAARQADLVLLVLDGRRELLPAEEELYVALRKLGKPMLVVLNKMDVETQHAAMGDYYNRLRLDSLFPVSAEHGRNIDVLEEELVRLLPQQTGGIKKVEPLRLAIVGRVNVGKSSLINRLCGEDRLLTSPVPGTTRDSTDTFVLRHRKIFCLIDTAGIRKLSRTRDEREKASILRARKTISRADVVCQILDATEFPTRQDLAIAHLAEESGKPLVLALNKWDLVGAAAASLNYRDIIARKMAFVGYAPVLTVSAATGKRVVKILDLAEQVYAASARRIDTSRLNEFLAWINATHPPLTRNRRNLKVKYITQTSVRPPTFLLFAARPSPLLPAYEKLFLQLLREKFGLWGTPLRLKLRRS